MDFAADCPPFVDEPDAVAGHTGSPWGKELARARTLHQHYIQHLMNWHAWLRDRMPRTHSRNALGLMLHSVIQDAMLRRSIGSWSRRQDLPTVDEMARMLDQDRYTGFLCEAVRRRRPMEKSAEKLCDVMRSATFIDEFDGTINSIPSVVKRDWQVQLMELADITTGLAQSWAGRRFMVESFYGPLPGMHEHYPVLHQERWRMIETAFLDLGEGFHLARRQQAIDAAVRYQLNLLPILHYVETAQIGHVISGWLAKYEFGPLPTITDWTDPSEFRQLLDWAKGRQRENPGPWARLPPSVAAGYQLLLSTLQLHNSMKEIAQDATAATRASMLQALAEEVEAANVVYEVFAKRPGPGPLRFVVGPAAGVSGAVDFVSYGLESIEDWYNGRYGQAVGNAMAGIGGIGSALGGLLIISGVAVPPMLALGSAALVIAGDRIAAPVEQLRLNEWLSKNYFGANWTGSIWADVTRSSDGPETLTYRWKQDDDSPIISRQISEYWSLLWPARPPFVDYPEPPLGCESVGRKCKEKVNELGGRQERVCRCGQEVDAVRGKLDVDGVVRVSLEFMPTPLAQSDTMVSVFAIRDETRNKVYEAPLNATVVPPAYALSASSPRLNLVPFGDKIKSWGVVLLFHQDSEPEYVEVCFSLPGVLRHTLRGDRPLFEIPDDFPLTLRVRQAVRMI